MLGLPPLPFISFYTNEKSHTKTLAFSDLCACPALPCTPLCFLTLQSLLGPVKISALFLKQHRLQASGQKVHLASQPTFAQTHQFFRVLLQKAANG